MGARKEKCNVLSKHTSVHNKTKQRTYWMIIENVYVSCKTNWQPGSKIVYFPVTCELIWFYFSASNTMGYYYNNSFWFEWTMNESVAPNES